MSSVSDQQWLRQIGVDLDADAAHDHDDECVSVDEAVDETSDDDGASSDNGAPPVGEDDSADEPAGAFDDDGDSVEPTDDESPCVDADLEATGQRTRRYTPWVLGAFAAVVMLATVITTLGVSLSGPDDASPSPRQHPIKSSVAPTMAIAPAPAPADGGDHPLPFTASSDCPAGASTSAKSIADPDKPSPWICVRHTDGQPLYITLGPAGIERAYVITAVSIVPGDTAAAQGSGGDPWLQHRVVTLLQWQFNDTAHTVVDQDTGNVHGEAVKPISGVSASKITVIIRQTSRPVAAPQPSASAPDGGPFGGILGGPAPTTGGPQPTSGPDPTGFGSGHDTDPSDGTFAVSSIKIIGHKAT
ncbi:hypothetical protein BN1232_06310 [Mycobacterium lentiflavum]|uniref:Uncharacterized protein n=2 Tax=Mycobacterium simiae complex TaxID=2249310 RepID=A0A0E4CRL3_MYCLN|nr:MULTISPECIES: hypothetical protein [Mycobacterium simiae complex]ORJ52686.1 hypothetical protein B5M45_30295 [Mycobacterium simiae]ULP45398.1 hypothetical protein MJO58_27925 [Mycobacterium lentiflavum]CQD24654.1 hypothetical protein BN1232_06310 [Mycobacterium lentiflavum]